MLVQSTLLHRGWILLTKLAIIQTQFYSDSEIWKMGKFLAMYAIFSCGAGVLNDVFILLTPHESFESPLSEFYSAFLWEIRLTTKCKFEGYHLVP